MFFARIATTMAAIARQQTLLSTICFLLLLNLFDASGRNSTRQHLRGCIDSEREALLQFKRGLWHDPGNRLSSWTANNGDCCKWRGISCDVAGHVIKLDLKSPPKSWDMSGAISPINYDNSSLGGTIGASLLGLRYLTYLDLSCNNFQKKPLSDFLGSLSNLKYLNLSSANLGGRIPLHLGNLSRLRTLDLSDNGRGLSVGDDPRWVSRLSSLRHLNLNNVNISSDGSLRKLLVALNMLPSLSWANLGDCGFRSLPSLPHVNFTSLSFLDLSFNGIESRIPEWLANITNLKHLDLSGNNFQGPIPSAIWSMASLEELFLFGNKRLDAKIPRNLSSLCKLQRLHMSYMNMSGVINELEESFSGCIRNSLQSLDLAYNQLSGSFPNWVVKMKRLKSLSLSSNSLQGPIPTSLRRLSSLEILFLDGNKLNNSIPRGLGDLARLTVLDLSRNQLQGVIPKSLGKLSSLHHLNLCHNKLSGGIPVDGHSNLSSLIYLDLSDNHLGGLVSTTHFSNLKSLQHLDLSNNQITGRLLDSLKYMQLFYLNLKSNRLEGAMPEDIGQRMPTMIFLSLSNNSLNGSIPMSLCRPQHLEVLDLSRNDFSGSIPNCWKPPTSDSLRVLNLAHNSLVGVIPSSLSFLSNLGTLQLNANSLSGKFPLSLRTCSSISMLNLGENKLSGNIPIWLSESMPNLKVLNLRSNNFRGVIPHNLASLRDLQIIDLANNELIGNIPRGFGNLTAMQFVHNINGTTAMNGSYARYYSEVIDLTTKGRTILYERRLLSLVVSIDLSANRLSGSIPQELTNLVGLLNLNISGNLLSGRILEDFKKLQSLESLDLSRNSFFGEIPTVMLTMTFLSHLNLSFNNFSGEIPRGNQLNTLIDPSIYMGNPYLCGFPLDRPCKDGDKQDHGNNHQGESEEHKNKDVLWMYGFTALSFILGFWATCGTLIMHERWRIMFFIFIDGMCDQLGVPDSPCEET